MANEAALTQLTAEQLSDVLVAHQLWLESAGEQGERARLYRVDLSGLDLSNTDWRQADLRECRFDGTQFFAARLNHANLASSSCLLAKQLAGADTSGARLPDDLDLFDRLKHIEALTIGNRNLFFVMLLVVGYNWLTIATTSDIALLTNAATSPLPVILTELPLAGFYWAAPMLLLGFYIYFHLQLQRLWEDLAALPAFFPDGRSLEEKVHPWLLTGLISACFTLLQSARPPMSRLQNAIAIALVWFSIPVTMAALWLRYLPRHDLVGSGFHIICLATAGVAGVLLYRLAITTLSGERLPRVQRQTRQRKRLMQETGLMLSALLLPPLLTYGAIVAPTELRPAWFDPRSWVPQLLLSIGWSPFADFYQQDVSIRPVYWSQQLGSQQSAPIDDVRGVELPAADLYRANAVGAFLIKANLAGANLQSADLELADLRYAKLQQSNLLGVNLAQADLRGSNLEGADLREAALLFANLQSANLQRVDLRGAFLNNADLRTAKLAGADLRNAYLNDADLRAVDFTLTILRNADLSGADLHNAIGLTCTQLAASNVNQKTRLPEELECSLP